MEGFIQIETVAIELLLVVALVAMAVRYLRIPYTVALVLVGLAITFRQPVSFEVTPELILAIFIPPLVFEAAFHINIRDLRHELTGILMLAVPGVLLTTAIVGAILAWGTQLSLALALVFGALIAATDPVAVVALFRTLAIPKRLSVLVEGESLLNDGTAIVVYNLVLAAALTNQFGVINGVVDFVRVAFGGVLIGIALGLIISRMIALVDDYLIETTLTTVLAFGAYLVAERLAVSGVLAVVAAGMVNGNLGSRGMSPTTRVVLFNFWEYVAFVANSLVFLLIGIRINISSLVNAWQLILVAILAVLAARVIVVYGLGTLVNRFAEPLPLNWQHVLAWSGLRGAVSLALVLALPFSLGSDRELLHVMTFGVVLFSLLMQGTTMGPLLRWLRIGRRGEAEFEYEMRHARLAALRMGESHLDRLRSEGLLSAYAWEKLKPQLDERETTLASEIREILKANPSLEVEELRVAHKELLNAQKSALLTLRRDGIISDEVFEKLVAEVDGAVE